MSLANYDSVTEMEEPAMRILPREIRDFIGCGADSMITLKDNCDAFDRIKLLPKMLVDTSRRKLHVSLLGDRLNVTFPVGVGPTSFHCLVHPDGEIATAKAAQDAGTVYVMSTSATCSIEEIAMAAPKAIKWLQLYVHKVTYTFYCFNQSPLIA